MKSRKEKPLPCTIKLVRKAIDTRKRVGVQRFLTSLARRRITVRTSQSIINSLTLTILGPAVNLEWTYDFEYSIYYSTEFSTEYS